MGIRSKGKNLSHVSRIYTRTSIYIWLESKINIYRHRSLNKCVLEIFKIAVCLAIKIIEFPYINSLYTLFLFKQPQ